MLKLVSNFDTTAYPKFVSVKIENTAPHSVHRLKTLAQFHFNNNGVADYFVFHDKKIMTFHFRTVREQMIGQGCLFPDVGAQFPLLEFKAISPLKLLEIAANLERTFNNAGRLHQDVKLLPIVENHSIDALVKNGPDIIQVMKWGEKLQAKFAPA